MRAIQMQKRWIILSLAVAASLLELGPIVFELQRGSDLLHLLSAGMAYQTGNVAPRFFFLRSRWLVVGTALVSALGLLIAPPGSLSWLAAVGTLSWTLQSVRRSVTPRDHAELPTTVQKRISRVIGFAASSLLPMYYWLVLVFGALVAAMPFISASRRSPSTEAGVIRHPLEWVMLVHQTHYFAYAYAVPLLVASATLGGIHFVGFWFAGGWVSYLSAEALWKRTPPHLAFISGHLILAAVLLLLSWLGDEAWAAAALWILSGFGGGTVYCLALLHARAGLQHERLELAEDIGHLLGAAVVLAGVMTLNWTAGTLPAVGSVLAILAATMMIAMTARRKGFITRNSTSRR